MKMTYAEYQASTNRVNSLLNEQRSFEIVDIASANLKSVTDDLEKKIESLNLTCRIYTKNRAASGILGGVAPLIAIAAHNIATWNPDYEVERDVVNGRVKVKWKK